MKVLIAVNDPDYAREITAFVLNHSWAPETEFEILAVNEDIRAGSVMAFLPGPVLDDLMTKTQELENQVLEDTAKALTQNMENMIVTTKISKGFPKEEILLEIKEWQPDVLFVGSHGRKGLDRVLLGSVSQYLVSNAPCSVIIIRAAHMSSEKSAQSSHTKNLTLI